MRLKIRVTMGANNQPKFELMNSDGEKIADVTATDILEMALQFTSSLRWKWDK